MQSLDFKGVLLTWFYYNSITGSVPSDQSVYGPLSNPHTDRTDRSMMTVLFCQFLGFYYHLTHCIISFFYLLLSYTFFSNPSQIKSKDFVKISSGKCISDPPNRIDKRPLRNCLHFLTNITNMDVDCLRLTHKRLFPCRLKNLFLAEYFFRPAKKEL